MKRHDILAALAAAAGLTLAAPAGATALSGLPKTETMIILQQQVGAQSDDALSQMIHLAKAENRGKGGGKGEKSGKGSGKSGKAGKAEKSDKSGKADRGDRGKHKGWGKGKGHHKHGKGKGKGHHHHHHPS